jgi:Ca2+-transporting ATPase
MIIGITVLITSLLLFVPVFSHFFLFETVSTMQIGMSILVGFVSVMWIEIFKAVKRVRQE